VKNWLTAHLLDPFNCTVPYLKDIPGVPKDTKICDPATIAKNYSIVTREDKSLVNRKCIPGCTKWEYGISLVTRPAKWTINAGYGFSLVVNFDNLQYEHVKEVSVGCEAR
jgi:hypothetical protein